LAGDNLRLGFLGLGGAESDLMSSVTCGGWAHGIFLTCFLVVAPFQSQFVRLEFWWQSPNSGKPVAVGCVVSPGRVCVRQKMTTSEQVEHTPNT
jgi:hypothetical protein